MCSASLNGWLLHRLRLVSIKVMDGTQALALVRALIMFL